MRTCCIAQGTLLHFAVQQKLTQHCKATILQKSKVKENKYQENLPEHLRDTEKPVNLKGPMLVPRASSGCPAGVL